MLNWLKNIFSSNHIPQQKQVVETLSQREWTQLDKDVLALFNAAPNIAEELSDDEGRYLQGEELGVASVWVALSVIITSSELEFDDETIEKLAELFTAHYYSVLNHQQLFNELNELFLRKPFKWEKFDECCQHCSETGLYPYYYQFLKKAPQMPLTIREATKILTTSQMKTLLKQCNVSPIPSFKEAVADSFCLNVPLEMCTEMLVSRIALLKERFDYKSQRNKIEIFMQSILSCRDAMRRHYKYSVTTRDAYVVHIQSHDFIMERQYDDNRFLKSLLEKENIAFFDQAGELERLPPIYPGDTTFIQYYYR